MYRDSLPPPSKRATRILVVSADRERRRRVTRLLRCEGYDVDTRDEGALVLEHVHAHPPDLVLLDVELPDANGLELCTALRSRDDTRVIPIVLVSTVRVDELSVVQGLAAGADDYVTHPARLAELKARVEVQLRNKRDRELLVWAYTQRALHRREARIDGLTGLANRRAGDDALDDAVEGAAPLVAMLLDIDHFKKVNDTYGHQAGDVVLRHVSRTLARLARQGDFVARFGGEEFLVLLRDAHPDVAIRVAERFRKGIESLELPASAGAPQVTVSVGVATWDGPSGSRADRAELVETADAALYEAKRNGRNRVVVKSMRPRSAEITREIRVLPSQPAPGDGLEPSGDRRPRRVRPRTRVILRPMQIVFDEGLWARTEPLRRAEWAAIVRDMLADPELRFGVAADTLEVSRHGSTTRFTLWRDGASVSEAAIPAGDTKHVIESYIDVVRQIEKTDQGLGSARIEVLDMAKKLSHDDGARALAPHCEGLGADHATCRHLFTLLVALRVDTTHMAGLRGHRRVR